MIGRYGLGPVFVYDMLSLARRWQVYAGRAAFVLLLLVGMTFAWWGSRAPNGRAGASPTIAQLAVIGERFFYALAGIQISFILLAAPASAAGSICVDRARGTLLHMMVTDLSDAEIVLGRLGARLAPVFGLMACALPVVALAGLLGGVDFGAMLGLFVVSIALAVLGCSLALAISIRAAKTHEVLMAVYLAFGSWLLALPIWWSMARGSKVPAPYDWFQKLNPYMLAFAPYTSPGFAGPADFAIFFGVVLAASATLVGWSILMMRRSVIATLGTDEAPRLREGWVAKLFPSQPGPTLDGNPVLWREWHRNRPSRLARRLWRGLLVVCWVLVAWGIFQSMSDGVVQNNSPSEFGLMLLLFFGLLIVAATASTVLAEERTRGSLDILLSTPLSTRSIVLGKWWGAYRMVLVLASLTAVVAIFFAAASPDLPVSSGTLRWVSQPIPLTVTDRFAGAAYSLADFLASGAVIVSIGVALATWVSRVGRAVTASVVIYFAIGVGWPILAETAWGIYNARQTSLASVYRNQTFMQATASLSPIFGPVTSLSALGFHLEPRAMLWRCLACVIATKLLGSMMLLWLTLRTFDRRLGRVAELRPRNDPRIRDRG